MAAADPIVQPSGITTTASGGAVLPSGGLSAPPGGTGNVNNTTGQSYGQTFNTPQVTPTTPSTITPGALNANPQPGNFQNAQIPPLYPTASLGSAYALTPEQQKAQGMTSSLEDLNTQLTGKAQDTINLYKQYGISTTTDANGNLVPDAGTQDLQAKLKALQNEAQAIPLQIQNAFEGRGATAAGVQPIQDAQLRENAIQALQTSSTIDAMNGNLQTAMVKVNAALTQKYGPIQAQISTLTNNLNLIKSSPEYDAETKAQAQQAQLQLAQYQQSLQLQADNYKNAQTTALSYAGSGANAQQLSQLQEIANKGGTQADVAAAATQMGLSTLQTQLQQAQVKQAPLDLALKTAAVQQIPVDIALKQSQLAQSQALTRAYSSPELLKAVQNGTVDPSRVNSRTAPFYNALANAGIDANSATINAKATQSVITNLDQQQAQITQAGSALESNMKYLASLSDKVNTLGVPKVDAITANVLSQYKNSPDIVKYLNVLNTVRSEYAKYLSRGSASGVTDSMQAEARNSIPAGIDGATLMALYQGIQTEGHNVQDSIQLAKQAQFNQLGTQQSTQPTSTKEGATYNYQGTTYKVVNGQWVAQ